MLCAMFGAMSTLAEIEAAVDNLLLSQQRSLLSSLINRLDDDHTVLSAAASRAGHSVLDIEPVSAGVVLSTVDSDDDLLG